MLLALALLAALAGSHARAEAAPPRADAAPAAAAPAAAPQSSALDSALTWFKHLREGLVSSALRGQFQHRSVSAVAAVRGHEQDAVDPDKPEWKLSTKSEKLEARKERAELSSVVELILTGKYVEGQAGLDAFEKAHPKSALLPEVAQARDNLSKLEGEKTAQAGKTPAAEPKK